MGSWKLGPCFSAYQYSRIRYNNGERTLYTERCCIRPGKYILACIGNPAKDWDNIHEHNYFRDNMGWNSVHGGFLEIQGHKYCDDAIIYNSMQIIDVVGTDNVISLIIFYYTL